MKASRLAVVIEDDPDIRQVIVTLLEATGLEVYSAGNGKDGVAAVRKHNPDVVTLDLSLPDIDGLEVAHRIRAFSDAYIVMLTARATEVATLQGLASGADDYVTKPFRPRELRARVESLLRRPRGGVAPPALPVPAAVPPALPRGGVAPPALPVPAAVPPALPRGGVAPPALPVPVAVPASAPAAPPAVPVTAVSVTETTTAAGPPDNAHPASPLGSASPAAAGDPSGSAASSGSE